jgi:hypothetical protein
VANYRVSSEYKKLTVIQQTKQNTHDENKTRKEKGKMIKLGFLNLGVTKNIYKYTN